MEFNITQPGILKMMAMDENGAWLPFYPETKMESGLFVIAQPTTAVREIKILLNGNELRRLEKK